MSRDDYAEPDDDEWPDPLFTPAVWLLIAMGCVLFGILAAVGRLS